MKAFIIYSAHNRLTEDHRFVDISRSVHGIYIRVERVETDDLSKALDQATPIPGEVVLNSIWAPPSGCSNAGQDSNVKRDVKKSGMGTDQSTNPSPARCPGPRQHGHPLIWESHCDHGKEGPHRIE